MNYLITGGTGLVGKALVEVLYKSGANITVLTRNVDKAAESLNLPITFLKKLSLADIENNDIIINLAGESIADKRWSATQKEKICHSRWDITQQLASLILVADKPPSIFISGSAIGLYGRQNTQAITEDFTQHHPEFTHTVCSRWESIALSAQSNKTRVALLRTGIVLAPNGGALAKMLPPFKLGLGGKIGDGKQMMSWIHIKDMVSAIIHIQNTPSLTGAINLTAEHAVNNAVFSHTLAKVLRRPSLLTTPAMMIKLLFGEMSDLLLFGQNVVPNKLTESGFLFKYNELPLALADIVKKR